MNMLKKIPHEVMIPNMHVIHVTYLAYRFLAASGGIHKISYSKLFSCVWWARKWCFSRFKI